MSPSLRHVLARSTAVLLTLLAAVRGVGGEFADLSRLLPTDANAIIVVNAEAIYNSPIGKRENWRERSADAFEETPMLLPPSARFGVMAANIDVATLKPEWEAAAMSLAIDPTVEQVAQRRGGTVDTVAIFGAVWLGDRTCVVKFGPKKFGLLTPAIRQTASRWAAAAATSKVAPLAPYLTQAIGYADTVGTEVILAIDLAGAISEAKIRAGVAGSPLLKGVAEDQAANVLASIQGVKLGVLVGENLKGKLQFDFAEDAALFAPVAKPLAIGILSKAGAMLEEFNGWTAKAQGKSLSIEGELTPAGMRRLFSLLTIDAAALERDDESASPSATAAKPPADPKAAMAKASLRYFRSVGKYVADAQELGRANSIQQQVMWIENYARKVEALPTRNVDPDLANYGKFVAQTFRWVVDQAYGVQDKLDQADQAEQGQTTYRLGFVPTARTVNYGGDFERMYAPYGFAEYHPNPNASEIEAKTQDEVYKQAEDARQALTQLAADQAAVGKKLEERYGIKF